MNRFCSWCCHSLYLGAAAALTLSIAVMGTVALAQGKTGGGRIAVSSDYWYFGYMPQDAIVSHSYWIRNVGTDTLTIIRVRPGCGCTTAPLSKDRIAPGDSAELKMVFDSKRMFGKVVKDVDIFSDDPTREILTVKFFAQPNREHPEIKAIPNAVRFSKFGAVNDQLLKTVEVKNASSASIKLRAIEYPSHLVKLDRNEVSIKAGQSATLQFEQIVIPDNEHDILSSVTFEFEGKETDRITIPIVCYFQRASQLN